MREEAFSVRIPEGVLRGHRGGEGQPALLLHGGPAVPDYMGACAAELGGLFNTIRYTQRGTPPSEAGPPYSIETHTGDALTVLDACEIDQAWMVGHSWGGHLALHLLAAHPERLLGLICIDPLGAYAEIFGEFGQNLRRGLASDEVERLEDTEERRRRGEASEAELLERWELIWPRFFADPRGASPPPTRTGVQCSAETNASIAQHFERGTLEQQLPRARLPALFVHGLLDPLPVRSSLATAALIPDSVVKTIPDCGHFPWQERPGELRRIVEDFLAVRRAPVS